MLIFRILLITGVARFGRDDAIPHKRTERTERTEHHGTRGNFEIENVHKHDNQEGRRRGRRRQRRRMTARRSACGRVYRTAICYRIAPGGTEASSSSTSNIALMFEIAQSALS